MMNNVKSFHLSREKHLDHMVRVVPFIVFCYAIQCYAIVQLGPTEITNLSIMVLGGFLSLMILSFVTYDLRHQVFFDEHELHSKFFSFTHSIRYEDIVSVEINEEKQSFASLTIKTKTGKKTYYFIDNADKVKAWLEAKKYSELNLAA